jgi:hypothetical protein
MAFRLDFTDTSRDVPSGLLTGPDSLQECFEGIIRGKAWPGGQSDLHLTRREVDLSFQLERTIRVENPPDCDRC